MCVCVCVCACVRACVRACVCVCVFITKPPAVMTPLTLRCIELARSPSMPPPRSRSGSRDASHACSDAAFIAAAAERASACDRTTGDSTARLKSRTSDPLQHVTGILASRQKASAHTAAGENCEGAKRTLRQANSSSVLPPNSNKILQFSVCFK